MNHDFGESLRRLLEYRGTGLEELAASSGVAESVLRDLLDGDAPGESHLEGLASALGFHAADLFTMADVALPERLTPLDRVPGNTVCGIVDITRALPRGQRLRVYRFVAELPQQERSRDAGRAASRRIYVYDQHGVGPGAMVMNMLCSNRNLQTPGNVAKMVARLTRGEIFLSMVDYHIAGSRGRLRPRFIVGFAKVLGIAPGDLAAISGVELPDAVITDDPLASEMAGLIWSLRRLSAAQAEHVRDEARSMLAVVPEEAPECEWNRVYHQRGVWWGAPRTEGED